MYYCHLIESSRYGMNEQIRHKYQQFCIVQEWRPKGDREGTTKGKDKGRRRRDLRHTQTDGWCLCLMVMTWHDHATTYSLGRSFHSLFVPMGCRSFSFFLSQTSEPTHFDPTKPWTMTLIMTLTWPCPLPCLFLCVSLSLTLALTLALALTLNLFFFFLYTECEYLCHSPNLFVSCQEDLGREPSKWHCVDLRGQKKKERKKVHNSY